MTDAIRLQPRTLKPYNTVALPGSKSISNRTLLLAALSDNECDIHSLLKSDDTDRMLEALAQLGVPLEHRAGSLHVVGQHGRFPHAEADLFLGNAGTAFRPLTAALAVLGGEYRLHGVARMHERPIGDLVDALRLAGAHIDYLGNEGYPPLHIHARHNTLARTIPIKGNVSSQFLTALLMALPLTGDAWKIQVEGELISKPYIDITLNLMKQFNVNVENRQYHTFHIPDAAMTLAVVALATGQTCSLRNIGSWRVKETDRIAAMAAELRKVGATVVEEAEAIHITPPEQLIADARIDTYDDHRMAMCFSLVSLLGVPVVINDPQCTHKTFPTYFDVFAGLAA